MLGFLSHMHSKPISEIASTILSNSLKALKLSPKWIKRKNFISIIPFYISKYFKNVENFSKIQFKIIV